MSLLSPLGWAYSKVTAVRNSLYDTGTLASHHLGARTISIGNITTGGTGKTPLVRKVAEILAAHGEKVCVLTRGYGRRNENERVLVSDWETVIAGVETAGDEPVELANQLTGKAIVVADADRIAAAQWSRKEFGITAFVLDDAFQHRRARRDLDIVCIDATDPFGNECLLPAGRLREPLSGLSRAAVIVITRADIGENVGSLESRIRELSPDSNIFRASTTSEGFFSVNDRQHVVSDFSESAFAFAGIGNPAGFFGLLRNENINLAGSQSFRDHRRYSQEDISKLENEAHIVGASVLITTGKDAVKLTGLKFKLPCLVTMIETTVDDELGFQRLITSSS